MENLYFQIGRRRGIPVLLAVYLQVESVPGFRGVGNLRRSVGKDPFLILLFQSQQHFGLL